MTLSPSEFKKESPKKFPKIWTPQSTVQGNFEQRIKDRVTQISSQFYKDEIEAEELNKRDSVLIDEFMRPRIMGYYIFI
jgi:hypothetical protein